MSKKRTTSRNCLYLVLVMCCCVIIVYYTLTARATRGASLQINQTSRFNNNNTQIIQPIVSRKTCSSAYLVSNRNGLDVPLWQYGFTSKCSRKERRHEFKKCKKIRKRCETWCKKYNNSNLNYLYTFCNGGKIIFEGNVFYNRLYTRLTVKTHLNTVLKAYCNKYHSDDNVCNFHLLSFDMSIEKELNEFLTKHIDCNNNKPQYDQTWVFKENRDMGTGIHILNNHQLIYRLIVNSSTENIKKCIFNPLKDEKFLKEQGFLYHKINEGYVVNRDRLLMQTFIANPLLIQDKHNDTIKHVFCARSYFLIASYNNPFIVLYWPKFILSINPYEYNNKEKMETKAMLTNRHSLVDDMYEWTWGPGAFQRYLDQIYGDTLFGGNYTTNKFETDVMHILHELFKANSYYRDTIGDIIDIDYSDVNSNDLYFDKWCMDIYINDKFELKLLEVNTFCGRPCDKEIIARKVQHGGIYDWDCDGWRNEAAKILLEMFDKKSNNETIDEIKSLNQYKIAFWEK